jgi:hypothetical protein
MFYLDLFSALDRHKVDYLLIGGLALNIYGVERATMDVDLLIALDDANVQRFIAAAQTLGMKPVVPVALEELADAEKRRVWIEQRRMLAFALQSREAMAPTVDILIAPSIDFATAFLHRVVKQLGALPVSLASVEDLVTLKRVAGRKQDLADIEALQRLRELGRA